MYYGVSRKNVLTWLAVMFMAGSALSRVVVACVKGAENNGSLWLQMILPIIACLLYAFYVVYEGDGKLYKTTFPMVLLTAYFCIRAWSVHEGFLAIALCVCLYVLFAVVHVMLTDGSTQKRLPYAAALLLLFGLLAWEYKDALLAGDWSAAAAGIPDVLVLLGILVMPIAMYPKYAERRHRLGDRVDGYRLHSLDPMMVIGAYFMPERNESTNYYEDALEITDIDAYIHKLRKEGYPDLGLMHILLAGYVRTVAQYPGLNRFISGQKIFTRDQDIAFSMVVKKHMSVDGEETVIKLHLKPDDTLDTVYQKFDEAVKKVKDAPDDNSGAYDSLVRLLYFVPGFVLRFVVWLLRTLDYYGKLPGWLLELSPFHASVFFTALGSLNIAPVYHHLYDFGNLPVFVAMGKKRVARELKSDGSMVVRRYMDIKMSLDERTVDGFYYAACIKHLKSVLKHPEQLMEKPEVVVKDVD